MRKSHDPQPAIAVEPRYSREMPWVLVLLAVGLLLYAGVVARETSVASRVTVTHATRGHGKPKCKHVSQGRKHHPCKTKAAAKHGKVTTITTTEKSPSDTLLGLLFGIAGIIAVAGAFYARVSKVSFPGGGGIELGAVDSAAIAKFVQEALKDAIGKKSAEEQAAFDADKLATLAATAAAQVQAQTLQVRAAAVGVPVATPTVAAPEITRAQRGMPLSDDLVKRLAENAVRETLADA